MIKINNYKEVRDLPRILKPTDIICRECQLGKQTRRSFKNKEYSTSHPLEIIHTDLWDPTRTCRINGERYFMLVIDDYSRMTWVTFFREKYEAFDRFKVFI